MKNIASNAFAKRLCPGCGQEFIQSRRNQHHCRPSCRYRVWERKHPRTGRLLWDSAEPDLTALCPLAQTVARLLLHHAGEWVSM